MLDNTPESWSERALNHRAATDAVGWSASGQYDRFTAVMRAVRPTAGERLLDFGCGTGALASWVPPSVDYHGVDWASGMVERARYDDFAPWRRFSTYQPLGHFDVVVAIGPFNLPSNWDKLRTWHTLRHLWDTTECRVLAASLYAGDDERCLRYTEAELEAFAPQLAFDVSVARHRPNDLLLVARR